MLSYIQLTIHNHQYMYIYMYIMYKTVIVESLHMCVYSNCWETFKGYGLLKARLQPHLVKWCIVENNNHNEHSNYNEDRWVHWTTSNTKNYFLGIFDIYLVGCTPIANPLALTQTHKFIGEPHLVNQWYKHYIEK